MSWVVLGGSGVLGRAVIEAVAGREIIVASRHVAGPGRVAVDVTTGAGLDAAFAGATVVIDATNAVVGARDVLVGGTERVLAAANKAGVGHFVGISIVGIDTSPFAYYRVKVEQERVIERGGVPWSLVRATQFHDLIPRFVAGKLGVVVAPIGWQLQPIDVREVAAVLVTAAAASPGGRLPDIGGPEQLPIAELARMWKRAAGKRRLVVPIPVPGARGKFLRSGAMCCADRRGRTFGAWLAERYANPPPSPPMMS